MSADPVVREHLVKLLGGRGAHPSLEEAVKDLPSELQGMRPAGAPHTPWQLLEHVRIAQWDILEFSRNAEHVSPDFPDGYWPDRDQPPGEAAWEESLKRFRADLTAMLDLVTDTQTDLYAPIPHGKGQTILREALLVADHNAYHAGQLVLVRRLLGAWPDS